MPRVRPLSAPTWIAVLLAAQFTAQPLAAQDVLPVFPFAKPEPPCTLWGPPERAGGKPVCRRRAEKPSDKLISCRLYAAPLDQETGNKMCTYRRPGLEGGETVVSVPSATPCAAALKC